MKNITIVAAQLNLIVGDISGNAERILQATEQAKQQHQAKLVVFPELALTSYPIEDLIFRPGLFDRCQEAMQQIIPQIRDVTIVLGYPEHVDGKNFNQVAVIQNQSIIATYAKQKLPNYTVFDEKRYFSPGHKPCVVDVNGIRVGVVICEDLWEKEPIQQAVAHGAQIIVSPNASPFDRHKTRSREMTLQQRVQENHVPIVYVNLVGGQDELVFDGGSMVVNSKGERCVQGKYYQEQLIPFDVQENVLVTVESQPLPARLSEIENLYQALTLGVRDYVHKNHFHSAVLGLSGGIDSALTLAIAVDALGADNVRVLLMPSRYTRDISVEDAKAQATTLGVQFDCVDIEPLFSAFLDSLAPLFKGHSEDLTEENLQARIRGMLLMAMSNKFGSIVLTTGNKSELAVGYSTLYGDMAGGFCVLKDILKTKVYELAKYRNASSPVIPQRVIERAPSAELAEGQTDQDSLPPYRLLDEIIYRYIELDEDPVHMIESGLNQETVMKIAKLIDRNEYKRRQAPVGVRTTLRAFGKDRRYPITSYYFKHL